MKTKSPRQHGFSLVEVVLSMGVVSFCMLTLSALIPIGLTANKASREQILALNFCRDIESDLKATAATSTASILYKIPLPSTGTQTVTLYDCNGTPDTTANNSSNLSPTFSTTKTTTSQYKFTIILAAPAATSPNDPVMANIVVTWPPNAATAPVGKVSMNVAINRLGS